MFKVRSSTTKCTTFIQGGWLYANFTHCMCLVVSLDHIGKYVK